MSSRWILGVAGVSLLVLPFLIVHAQEAPSPDLGSSADQTPVAQAASPEGEAADLSAEEQPDEVLGATTEEEAAATEGVSVASTETGEPASSALLEIEEAASSSSDVASSTEPIIASSTSSREVRTVFLQPSVEMGSHLQVGPVTATITLANLTCRYCETASPSVNVKAYYTEWYDNDGVDRATTNERALEQIYSVSPIAPWESGSVQWTGEVSTPGRYSFVVLVDPDNLIGARDTYRTEFFVD